MPVQDSLRVVESRPLGGGYQLLALDAPQLSREARPGQFAMLSPRTEGSPGWDPLLARPMSFLSARAGRVEFFLRAGGRGTRMLAAARAGERLPVVGPLGRGFPAPAAPRALLVAGGVGMPPMLHLAEETQGAADGAPVPELTLLYGGRSREHIHLTDRFFAAGCGVEIATDDGSVGERGPVTVLLERHLAAAPASARPDVFACGPEPMLRAVAAIARRHGARCFIAAEARMACGVGCCRGCAIELSGAGGRIAMCCTDGPVFDAEALYG